MDAIINAYSKFDAEWYMKNYFATEKAQKYMLPEIQALHKLVYKSDIDNGILLDIGTGPTVHTILSASARVKEVYLSDYSSINLNYLEQWLNGERQIPRKLMQCFIKTEGTQFTQEDRENDVRSKVKGILHIDVNSPQPLGTWNMIKEFDVIISSACIESATTTKHECQQAVINMTSLLKKGGTMLLTGGFGGSQYKVGDIVYRTLNLSKSELQEILLQAGLTVQNYEDVSIEGHYDDLYDSPTWYYVTAKKL